jgi:hypothetical protein
MAIMSRNCGSQVPLYDSRLGPERPRYFLLITSYSLLITYHPFTHYSSLITHHSLPHFSPYPLIPNPLTLSSPVTHYSSLFKTLDVGHGTIHLGPLTKGGNHGRPDEL